MGRQIGGTLAGIAVALVAITLIEYAGSLIFPVAAPSDDPAATVAAMPAGAKAIVVAAWLFGTEAGTIAAGFLSRRPLLGWVPAVLVALSGLATVAVVPHPFWMGIASVAAPLIGGTTGIVVARQLLRARVSGAASRG